MSEINHFKLYILWMIDVTDDIKEMRISCVDWMIK
jgi:hypothetical protein